MKPEPLKGKKWNSVIGSNDIRYWSSKDIKSAVEWLRESLFRNDDVTPRSFRIISDTLDKAFEDVIDQKPKGD